MRKYSGTKKASLTKERRTQGVGSFAAIFGIKPLFTLGSYCDNYCSAKFPSKRIYTYAYGPCYRGRTVVFFLSLIGIDIAWTLYDVHSR